jgi:hypothetical protein
VLHSEVRQWYSQSLITGLIRTGNGREVRFELPSDDILDERDIRDLSEGMTVGFDLGWTSRGLRVTQIKIG